jgi:hypothetical protein
MLCRLSLLAALMATPALADDLRPLCPDRPGKGTSPCTVDTDHLQVEVDAFDVTTQRQGNISTTVYDIADPELRFGVSDNLELSADFAPYMQARSRDRTSGVTTTASGIGDLTLRLKWMATPYDGGPFAMALMPFVKIPTAPLSIGNGALEGGFVVPLSYDLGGNWSLGASPELDLLKNQANGGRHVAIANVFGINRNFDDGLSLGAEFAGTSDFDPAGGSQTWTFDISAAWQPGSELQWDAGFNFGLNRNTPDLQFYTGVTRRF